MSLRFYLSYANADYNDELRRFFVDLNATLRARLQLPPDEQIGFLDSSSREPDSEWSGEAKEALKTSSCLVALISPAYLKSESSGKEWQIFKIRSQLSEQAPSETNDVPPVILPVLWIPCEEQMPKFVRDGLFVPADLSEVYRKLGVAMLRQDRLQEEYPGLLVALAEQIAQTTRKIELPAADVPSMDEVPNAFNKFKIIVIEGHQQVREMLTAYLEYSDLEVESYADAKSVPANLLADNPATKPPDLFLFDLEFEATRKTEGLNFLARLKKLKSRPSVMVMCAGLSNENLMEAIGKGAEDVVPKPFDVGEIVKRIENLASIGRNRRLCRPGQFASDSRDKKRKERPIFLSYSGCDNDKKGLATFLRSSIEARGIQVWYADDNPLPDGSEAARVTLMAIDDARVYIPLITDSYPSSHFCLAELVRFYSRLVVDHSKTLLPVLHYCPQTIQHFAWIKPIVDENPYADLNAGQILDGLIALLAWIPTLVNGYGPKPPVTRHP